MSEGDIMHICPVCEEQILEFGEFGKKDTKGFFWCQSCTDKFHSSHCYIWAIDRAEQDFLKFEKEKENEKI
jgi:hypothetical protein